jgi:hypothetical protein
MAAIVTRAPGVFDRRGRVCHRSVSGHRMRKRFVFDRAYYERHYRDPRTRVGGERQVVKLGAFVAAYLRYLEQPVATVIDFGCGLGHWRRVVQRHFPRARYTGVELSAYLCRVHGWQRGSVVDWKADEPADFVVCHGVLQYLDAGDARRAVRNLARNCRGALFLEALTCEDWERHCDQERTDGGVYLRPAAWYRRELRGLFKPAGGGVFLRPTSPAVLYELETCR